MLFSAILLTSFAGSRGSRTLERDFKEWELRYNKTYPSAQHRDMAFMKWLDNLAVVEKINSDKGSTWKASLNTFADLTPDEFRELVLLKPIRGGTKSGLLWNRDLSESVPESFDWRDLGAVTPVHDQGTVGTCWAFSTIGNVEGQWFLKTNELKDLSEEFLVDCDGTHDEEHADCGVFGGWPYLAYQYIVEAGGVPSEDTWPYCSGTGDCYPCMQGPISLCGPPPYYWQVETQPFIVCNYCS